MEIKCLNPQQNNQNDKARGNQQQQRHNKGQERPDHDIGRQGEKGQPGQKQPGSQGGQPGQPGQKPGQGQGR